MSLQTNDRHAITTAQLTAVQSGRWSPRSFDREAIMDPAKLKNALEAARWAPSAYNMQPWRYIVGLRGDDVFNRTLQHLSEFNQTWAGNASALITAVAVTEQDGHQAPTALYDLGLSAESLVLQATADGLATHQMSGIDAPALESEFALPTEYRVLTVIAIGTLAAPDELPEPMHEREIAPRERRALSETVLKFD